MNNKLLDYVLMKKEIEMGNKLNQEQEAKFKQMDAVYNSDETIKNEIDKLLNASSLNQAYDILSGKYVEEPVQKVVETEPILSNDNQGGESITNEQEKVLVLANNKLNLSPSRGALDIPIVKVIFSGTFIISLIAFSILSFISVKHL